MLPIFVLTRRAVAAAALLAAAPITTSGKKRKSKKKTKKKSPPPLAFVAARVTGIFVADGGANFVWQHPAEVSHPASGFTGDFSANTTRSVQSSESQVRAAIVATLKQAAALNLNGAGHPVPEHRIAVVLL